MKLLHRMTSCAALGIAALVTLPAQAQFAKPEDAIKYRKAAFTVMATHFSRVGAVVKGERPFNAAEVQANVAVVEAMSKLPFDAFVAGTDTGDTKAKPEIWKEQDKFKQAAEKMQAEVAKLSAAAKTGNLDQVKAAFGGVGQSCKACHDNYRK